MTKQLKGIVGFVPKISFNLSTKTNFLRCGQTTDLTDPSWKTSEDIFADYGGLDHVEHGVRIAKGTHIFFDIEYDTWSAIDDYDELAVTDGDIDVVCLPTAENLKRTRWRKNMAPIVVNSNVDGDTPIKLKLFSGDRCMRLVKEGPYRRDIDTDYEVCGVPVKGEGPLCKDNNEFKPVYNHLSNSDDTIEIFGFISMFSEGSQCASKGHPIVIQRFDELDVSSFNGYATCSPYELAPNFLNEDEEWVYCPLERQCTDGICCEDPEECIEDVCAEP